MQDEIFSIFKKIYSVLVPEEILHNKYNGELYGVFNEITGIFNILPLNIPLKDSRISKLGTIFNCKNSIKCTDNDLIGFWDNDQLTFLYDNKQIEFKSYSITSDIVSRNKGIVDNVYLKDSYALIVGCGSVGSFIALELAKCGVGNFILVDNDTFSYHNISRHQCGILDVGKRKIDAIEERLYQINPNITVIKYYNIIQDVFLDELKNVLNGKNGIIINCGDNRLSSYYSNKIAMDLGLYFLSAGASYLAAYGELFWYIPNANLPCYACFYGNNFNKTNNNQTIRHWYAGEEQLAKEDFIPALSVDIDYINVIATKFALDLLMLKNPNYKPRYIQYATPFMFISNFLTDASNNEALGISEPLQIVKTNLSKKEGCILCGKNSKEE